MRIEDLKRWHWVVIGLVLGVVLACVQNGIGTDALLTRGARRTISQAQFEEDLLAKPMEGHPRVTDIRVYPDGKIDLVKLSWLVSADKNNPKSKQRRYESWQFEAHRPYSPTDPSQETSLLFNPDLGMKGVELAGWESSKGAGWRDPGAGSEVRFALKGGSYVVELWVAGAASPDQLTAQFNGNPLPSFETDKLNPRIWRTTVPASAMVSAKIQVLKLARKDNPIQVRDIRISNPSYSVLNFLADAKEKHPEISWEYGWWVSPRATLILWTAGGLIVVGGIWPTLIGLMVGAGFARPPREPKPKLEAGTSSQTAPVPSAESHEMQKNDALPEEEPVSSPAASVVSEENDPDQSDAKSKKFVGEFYPVARK